MELVFAAGIFALLLLLNSLATAGINELGILQGAQRKKWLLIIWLLPFVGLLIFAIMKPKLYGPFIDEEDQRRRKGSTIEAVEALADTCDGD